MKILIACGGTGGHLFPGLAVTEALMARRHQVRMLVSEKAVDQTALAALAGGAGRSQFAAQPIAAIGYGGPRHLIRFCSRLAGATCECAAVCEEFMPDAVLGMGGFTSAPAVLAARWRRAPTLIHESNAVPGKANRYVGTLVDHVAVGLAECAPFFRRKPVTVTGTPVRLALRGGRVPDAGARLGLGRGRLTVLVVGGSQGARALNDAMASTLPWLKGWAERIQFLHLSGARDEESVRDCYAQNGFAARVMPFCAEMELAYSAADLVIARAGAATLTEIAAFGLPSILVPYPQAAGNHQWHNAQVFARRGAARVIEQAALDTGLHATRGERLGELLTQLLEDEGQRNQMAEAARSLAVMDAAERIAVLVEQLC